MQKNARLAQPPKESVGEGSQQESQEVVQELRFQKTNQSEPYMLLTRRSSASTSLLMTWPACCAAWLTPFKKVGDVARPPPAAFPPPPPHQDESDCHRMLAPRDGKHMAAKPRREA